MKFIKVLLKKWLGSRRVILTVAGAGLVIANRVFGWGLSEQDIVTILAIFGVFILGESWKDAKFVALQEVEKVEDMVGDVVQASEKKAKKASNKNSHK